MTVWHVFCKKLQTLRRQIRYTCPYCGTTAKPEHRRKINHNDRIPIITYVYKKSSLEKTKVAMP